MEKQIEFLKELLNTNSVNPPGNEEQIAKIIAKELNENGIASTIRPIEENRAYLIAKLKGNGNKKSLVFSGHMDTVPPGDIPWKYKPFEVQEINGRLYGRGASDMKGGLAALTMAMVEIAKEGIPLEGDLILAATAGEEVDSLGAKAVIQDDILKNIGAMIIGEPSSNEIFISHKGALWLEVISYGKTAHGSMPDKGINAIENMNSLINILHNRFKFKYKENNLLGEPTLNISIISGGIRTNMVPNICKMQMDIRTVPGQNHQEIISDIKFLIKEIEKNSNAKFELKILNNLIAVETSMDDPFVELAQSTADELFNYEHKFKGAKYYTDASTFVSGLKTNFPLFIYGPGEESIAHQANEYIEISKYLDAIKFYKKIALRYLK
ncbi:ArgE/DapE family deacylase [Clostridium sp. HV4-5-A1G]|uniref:ArgE/DapE family deacylase n=1 Tax=Clostridium sp. HV4-5-A1G TaxID=2004595 RepID=UPI00123C770B|nr:ArgE/DapE family deacylase [Clostridium sp. HV4-5-A1G]KAA8670346.1 ArgE/DapE family deacylase [Clostridium sp. HV4-5-A1G]